MLKQIFLASVAAALVVTLTPSKVDAYGAAHVGYTRVGPQGGVYHTGGTVGYGPGGVSAVGHTNAYGPGGANYHAGYGGVATPYGAVGGDTRYTYVR